MVKFTPKQGDIVWLEFDPQKGKEIQKKRPALTISPLAYNAKTGLGLFMLITSKIKGYPFEVVVDEKEFIIYWKSNFPKAVFLNRARFLE